MTKKKLKWGETPWDGMSREELLREVQRMYAACDSARSALSLCRDGSLFWGESGTGGRAMHKVHAVVQAVHDKYDPQNIYSVFFRYAVDLLFSPALGFQWHVCDHCKTMIGGNPFGCHGSQVYLVMCPDCARDGHPGRAMRPLEWKDLEPVKRANGCSDGHA